VLANDKCRKILEALADEPLNSSQLSEKLNLPLTTVEYNIDRLSEAGLIAIHHKRWSQKGKKINFYSPAEKFILIAPKMHPAKIMKTLQTLVLPVIAIVIITAALFSFYSYSNFGAGAKGTDALYAQKYAPSNAEQTAESIPETRATAESGAAATVAARNFTNNTSINAQGGQAKSPR
jgi:DNA-binding transcriptional ArsR family regulator